MDIVLTRPSDRTRFTHCVDYLTQFGVASVCLLPLTTGQRRLGSVIFGSPVRGFYREEVLQFLLPVAGQIALAMGDAVHCAELQNTRARLDNETTKLKLLLELNNAIVS